MSVRVLLPQHRKAYTNSSIEHAITIAAGQWYATEAQRLLKLIHTTMGDAKWKTYDKDGKLWKDVQKSNWSTYKKTTYKKRIVNIIKSDIGKKCQDQLMYQQITEMEKAIRTLGITDIQAVGMFINMFIRRLLQTAEIRLVHIRQDRRKYING